MLRMDESLKLARLPRGPSVFATLRRDKSAFVRLRRDKLAERFVLFSRCQNVHKEFRLAPEKFRRQSGVFARLANRGKIDMGGEVLAAGIRQKVVGGVVAEIRAKRSPVRAGENISSAVKP